MSFNTADLRFPYPLTSLAVGSKRSRVDASGVQEQVLSLPLVKSRKDSWAEAVPARSPPAQGVPRGGGQLSRRRADAPRGLELGASAPGLAALPWGRRVGAGAPQRPESAGQGRELIITASVGVGGCVWREVRVLGRLLFISLLFANGRGGSFRVFPPWPSSGGTPLGAAALPRGERAGPGSGARGLFTALPAEGTARYLCAGSGRSPAPSRRPLTAGRQPRPPLPRSPPRAAPAPCAYRRRHGAVPPRSTPSAGEPERRARWGGPGEERGFACLSPAPLPPPLPRPIGAEGSAHAADAPEGAPLLK